MTRKALKTFYLDKQNAMISGVCAGIADYLDWDVRFVRVGFVVGFVFWAPITLLTYVVLAWFVDPKPADLDTPQTSSQKSYAKDMPHRRRFAKLQTRFQKIEERMRRLETEVTSRAFQMDRELGR